MFFVVTTGRSGSTSIAHALSAVDGCHSIHEAAPELILESSGYRYGDVSADAIRKILRNSRHSTVNGEVYCETNQTLSLIIPVLAEEFPQARFVWLIRNGMDVVASAYQKQWYTGHSENHDRYEDCPPLEKAWIDGRVRADRVGEMTESEWSSLPRFDKCCWYWGFVNRVIEADLNICAAGGFFALRLEEAEQRLPELIHWMGFNSERVPTMPVENPAKRELHHWTEWTPEEHAAFDRWCGPVMDRHYAGWREIAAPDRVRVFVAPAIRSSVRRAEVAEARAGRAEARLRWIERHWSFKWYRRLRRLIADRRDMAR